MALNTDKRCVAFSKVKNYVLNRKKLLRFDLHPNLEREECMVRDLSLLKRQNYSTLGTMQSEVWCERFDAENPVQVKMLPNHDAFWDYVFSDSWQDCTSLRVCEGELLDRLQEALYLLLEDSEVKTYKMARFDLLDRPVKSILKDTPHQKSPKYRRQPVKITFTYFALDYQSGDPGSSGIPSSFMGSASHQSGSCSSDWGSLELSLTGSAGTELGAPVSPRSSGNRARQTDLPAGESPSSSKFESQDGESKGTADSRTTLVMLEDPEGVSSSYNSTSTITRREKRLPPESVTDSVVCFHIEPLPREEDEEGGSNSNTPASSLSTAKLPRLVRPHAKKASSKGRLLLTDESEHVIVSDGDDDDDNNIQFSNFSRADAKTLPHYFTRKHHTLKHQMRLPHKLPMSYTQTTPQERLGLKGAWSQKTKKQSRTPNQRRQSIHFRFGSSVDNFFPSRASKTPNRTPCPHEDIISTPRMEDNYYSTSWIPLMKSPCKDNSTDKSPSNEPPSHDDQSQPFVPLDANRLKVCHNMANLERYRRFEQLKKAAKISPKQRTLVHTMLEDLLEESMLPRIQKKAPPRIIKLNPVPFREKPQLQVSPPNKDNDGYSLPEFFPVKSTAEDFIGGLLQAVEQFVVRKEQVTCADGWTTITSVTFNRRFTCRYD